MEFIVARLLCVFVYIYVSIRKYLQCVMIIKYLIKIIVYRYTCLHFYLDE